MKKILPISLKLNFTPNTLGGCGLNNFLCIARVNYSLNYQNSISISCGQPVDAKLTQVRHIIP